MERLDGRDDAASAACMLLAPTTRGLDCALVGLGAGIGEEDAPLGARHVGQHVVDALGELAAVLDIVVVAHVDELVCLLLDSRDDFGVVVANAAHADARQEVAVLLAVVVVQARAGTAHELHRLAHERLHEVLGIELLLLLQRCAHLLISFRWTGLTGRVCLRSY